MGEVESPELVSTQLTPCSEEKVRDKVDKLYHDLRKKATCVPGIGENMRMPERPSWFDEVKFKRAQKWVRSYFTSVFLGHLAGLSLGFMMPSLVPPMAATQSHSTVSKLFRRYLNTILYIKLWYENDPYEENGIAQQAFRKVNFLHKFVIRKMNSPGDQKEEENPLWLSQYDMVLIEWSIIAPILLHPQSCGIHDMTREQAEDLIHFWAVTTYNVGIKDEFNILRSGNYDEAYWICKQILDKDIRSVSAALKAPANVGLEEGRFMTISLQVLCPIFSLTDLMIHWAKVWTLPVANLIKPTKYRFPHMPFAFVMYYLCQFKAWHWIMNLVFRKIMVNCKKRMDEIATNFEKEYPDNFIPFEMSTAFKPQSVLAY